MSVHKADTIRWRDGPPAVLTGKTALPLAVGIHEAMQGLLADPEDQAQHKALSLALRWYCSTASYLDTLLNDLIRDRFGCDGAPDGTLSDTDRVAATARLVYLAAKPKKPATSVGNPATKVASAADSAWWETLPPVTNVATPSDHQPVREPEPFRGLRWASGSPPPVLLRVIVPLSGGIHLEFEALLADPVGDRLALGEALRWHVNTVAYNRAVMHLHAVRFDAAGMAGAAITKDERALAERKIEGIAKRRLKRAVAARTPL